MDIDVPRNGQFQREFTLVAQDESPIDLTGATIQANARDIPGGTIIAAAVITITEAMSGKFEMLWTGADFESFGNLTQVARPSYDVKVIRSDITEVPFRGQLNLLPESTP